MCYAVQSFIVPLEGIKVLLLIFVEGPFCFFANVGLSGHLRFIDVLVDGPKQINEFCLGLPVLLFEQTFLFGLNLCPIDLRVEFILQQIQVLPQLIYYRGSLLYFGLSERNFVLFLVQFEYLTEMRQLTLAGFKIVLDLFVEHYSVLRLVPLFVLDLVNSVGELVFTVDQICFYLF